MLATFQKLFTHDDVASLQTKMARVQYLNHVKPIVTSGQLICWRSHSHMKNCMALVHLGKGKSPGWDGCTVQFFSTFWDDLKGTVLSMINCAWSAHRLPPLWKHGIVKLVPQKRLCETLED